MFLLCACLTVFLNPDGILFFFVNFLLIHFGENKSYVGEVFGC